MLRDQQNPYKDPNVENMDSDTDCIVASLNLEGITNNHNTWYHLAVCKQMSSIFN